MPQPRTPGNSRPGSQCSSDSEAGLGAASYHGGKLQKPRILVADPSRGRTSQTGPMLSPSRRSAGLAQVDARRLNEVSVRPGESLRYRSRAPQKTRHPETPDSSWWWLGEFLSRGPEVCATQPEPEDYPDPQEETDYPALVVLHLDRDIRASFKLPIGPTELANGVRPRWALGALVLVDQRDFAIDAEEICRRERVQLSSHHIVLQQKHESGVWEGLSRVPEPGRPRLCRPMGRRLLRIAAPPTQMPKLWLDHPGSSSESPEETYIAGYPVYLPGETMEERVLRLGRIRAAFSPSDGLAEGRQGEPLVTSRFPLLRGPLTAPHWGVCVVDHPMRPSIGVVHWEPWIRLSPEEKEREATLAQPGGASWDQPAATGQRGPIHKWVFYWPKELSQALLGLAKEQPLTIPLPGTEGTPSVGVPERNLGGRSKFPCNTGEGWKKNYSLRRPSLPGLGQQSIGRL